MTQYTYKYPRPAVTADCVVMTKETTPQVLLIERGFDPYKGCWAFPGGFMNMDETTEQCAIRELEEATGAVVGAVTANKESTSTVNSSHIGFFIVKIGIKSIEEPAITLRFGNDKSKAEEVYTLMQAIIAMK